MSRRRPHDADVSFRVQTWPETAHWSLGETVMVVYLTTCPAVVHYGRSGLFPMTAAQIDLDRPGWTIPHITKALDGLVRRGEIAIGDGWMFVERVLRRAILKSESQINGAIGRLEQAPRHSEPWAAFMASAFSVAPALYRTLADDERNRPPVGGYAHGVRHGIDTVETPEIWGGAHGVRHGVDTVSRLEGAPGGVRDTTPQASRAAAMGHHLGRIEGSGRGPASSAAEPHGNAPGGDARNLDHAHREGGAA